MNWNDHQARLFDAVTQFMEQDIHLLQIGVHEVAITSQLGCYLRPMYPDYNVDCEYNRHGADPKKHPLKEGWIRPDILVHRRMTDEDNTLVFEAKVGRNDNFDDDFAKLIGMTDQAGGYRYDFGIHIHFQDVPQVTFTVFENGADNPQLTNQLNEAWAAACA